MIYIYDDNAIQIQQYNIRLIKLLVGNRPTFLNSSKLFLLQVMYITKRVSKVVQGKNGIGRRFTYGRSGHHRRWFYLLNPPTLRKLVQRCPSVLGRRRAVACESCLVRSLRSTWRSCRGEALGEMCFSLLPNLILMKDMV